MVVKVSEKWYSGGYDEQMLLDSARILQE